MMPAHVDFEYIAGDVSLDFVNTVSGELHGEFREKLIAYDHLLAWAQGVGIINQEAAERLIHAARQKPEEASQALAHAVDLRETLYSIFITFTRGGEPAPAHLEKLNREMELSLRKQQVHLHDGEVHIYWKMDGDELDLFLAPVVGSAVALLTSGNIHLVKECSGDECGWLFVDRSRNHSRRWCTMQECGNVAKVRRFRGRSKTT